MFSPTTLEVLGYRSEPLPNLFWQAKSPSGAALVLPGMGYGPEYAGLSYSIALLAELGFDVLALKSRYATPEFRALSEAEAVEWLRDDALGAFQALGVASGQRLCLVGKSIGTLGMAALLEARPLPQEAQLVWLTPLLGRELVRRCILQFAPQSLIVIGTADHAYDAEALNEARQAGARVAVLDGVNHGLMVEGDAVQSTRKLLELLEELREFLTRFGR